MMSTKVYPTSYNVVEVGTTTDLKRRAQNIGKWVIVTAGLPLGYLWIPLSCCFRNPIAKVISDNEDDTTTDDHPCTKMAENAGVAVYGTMSTLSIFCCCFGCCGAFSPRDL